MAQEYDVTLKRVLERSHAFTTAVLGAGSPVEKWFNVELPMVQNTRVDLVGETSGGQLLHFEIQSTNDPSMPLRMAEYWVQLYRKFRRAPRQIVLYFGDETLRMPRELNEGTMGFSYTLIDVREMDGDALVAAEAVGDKYDWDSGTADKSCGVGTSGGEEGNGASAGIAGNREGGTADSVGAAAADAGVYSTGDDQHANTGRHPE